MTSSHSINSIKITRIFKSIIFLIITLLFFLSSCGGPKSSNNDRIIIGIPSDVQTDQKTLSFK